MGEFSKGQHQNLTASVKFLSFHSCLDRKWKPLREDVNEIVAINSVLGWSEPGSWKVFSQWWNHKQLHITGTVTKSFTMEQKFHNLSFKSNNFLGWGQSKD